MSESRRLGRYLLDRQLATGGMAEIWLAHQEGPAGFAKQIVIKKILAHLANDQKFVEMFLDEARLAAQLSHPNIGQIFDLGQVDGEYFIAMEFIDGWDLERIIERSAQLGRAIPPEVCARIIADACTALDYAHSWADPHGTPAGLVHRDVSPQNILVTRSGVVKLVDFGVAKARTSSHKTQTGAVKGKLSYMSPEQITAKDLDGRSDIFAVGIVLYELLTTQRPFGHESELLAVTGILNDVQRSPRELNVEVPETLEAVIERALMKRRDDRFATAGEMQVALEQSLHAMGRVLTAKDVGAYLQDLFSDSPSAQWSARLASSPRARLGGPSDSTLPHHNPANRETNVLGDRAGYEQAADEEPQRRSGAALLAVVIAIVLVVVGGGGFALWTWVLGPALAASDAEDGAVAQVPPAEEQAPSSGDSPGEAVAGADPQRTAPEAGVPEGSAAPAQAPVQDSADPTNAAQANVPPTTDMAGTGETSPSSESSEGSGATGEPSTGEHAAGDPPPDDSATEAIATGETPEVEPPAPENSEPDRAPDDVAAQPTAPESDDAGQNPGVEDTGDQVAAAGTDDSDPGTGSSTEASRPDRDRDRTGYLDGRDSRRGSSDRDNRRAQTGTVRVVVISGGRSVVYAGSQRLGEVTGQGRFDVPVGRQTIRVVPANGDEFSQTVNVEAGGSHTVRVR